jgi:serine/threonine-protein kinase
VPCPAITWRREGLAVLTEIGKTMPTTIGPFEILSELSKSPTGTVYKANDPETGQTIALKTIQLSEFGEQAAALEQALLAEAESTKVLSSSNITPVFGAGVIEGQFCAAMEYVQGNSIATMLARKEGFSIWDLLDIGRQLCSGLEHAKSHNLVHYNLEPAKIMCGWDSTVRILSFGVSSVGKFVQHIPGGVPSSLHYMSPEQVLADTMDGRSNLFSLGAMLYEMVTERKAFDRDDVESLRQSILDSTPVAPIHVNAKVHPVLSDLIMKALEKDPAQRYQSPRELLDDLEKCKESKTSAKKGEAPKGLAAAPKANPLKPNPAAQAKFATPVAAKPAPKPAPAPNRAPVAAAPASLARPVSPVAPAAAKPAVPVQKPAAPAASAAGQPAPPVQPAALAKPVSKLAAPKAAAAAAGAGSSDISLPSSQPELDPPNQFITACVKATIETPEMPSASMSSAVIAEPAVEAVESSSVGSHSFEPTSFEPASSGLASDEIAFLEPDSVESSSESSSGDAPSFEEAAETSEAEIAEESPKLAVDPMMAEGGAKASSGVSFSEMTELPPLKEVYIAPPPDPVPSVSVTPTRFQGSKKDKDDEKPKIQPREVAQKAIKEIKGVPPKLMFYALGGAAALILAIGIGVTIYIHSLNSDADADAGAGRTTAAADAPAQQDTSQPEPKKAPAHATPPAASQPTEAAEPPAPVERAGAAARGRNAKKKTTVAAAVIPGQLAIDSTPQGAQVQVDGASDPSYVTPFLLTNLAPGPHSITVSKAGYSTDTRSVDVTSANRATTVIHLAQLMATLIVRSDPPGASIYVDGRDVGPKTPAQVSVDKGQHVVLVRMPGYLDETMSGQFVLGQTFNFAPTLRPLGNADSIKTVNKMSKLFGGKGAQAGQATLSIHTQPKGAQVAINQHMLEKSSPVDVALDPGNYVVDITLSGYAPIHKVINADKGGKVVVDEVMQPQ